VPINTVEDLREHIALAAEVELSTIPPYLYALYSIEDQRSEAALLIRSIVAEEMLHVSLATNLLLAVGGEPRFGESSICPSYPGPLPHHIPELIVNLAPCSDDVIRNTLMVIEQPEVHGAPPEEDQFETLGQFYYALELAIERLAKTSDIFADPQRDRQLADPSFYTAVEYDAEDSGGLMLIDDVASADAAIEIIVHQGEGLSDERWADESHQELTHYYKLEQIADGTSPLGDVRPLLTNPYTADLPEDVRPVSDLFNALYRYTILTLDELFAPSNDKGGLVDRLYTLMSAALAPTARYLTELPVGDGYVAGPTFEVYEFSGEPAAELRSMVDALADQHPTLAGISKLLD
jgi:rubrerythrin